MVEAGERYRRRRRRSRGRAASPLRHPAVGRFAALVVAVLALADVAFTASALRGAALAYGLVGPGMSKDDVRYAMGAPASATDATGGGVWTYRQGSGRYRVAFDPQGRLTRVSCTGDRLDSADCPDLLGLHLGTPEEQVWYALGAPDDQRYAGDAKLLAYRSLGVTFTLRRLQVVEISLAGGGGGLAYLSRLPRLLVP